MDKSISFSPLIIGTMRLGDWGVKYSTQELEKFIDECLDRGLSDFDHADIYGHYTEETNFGQVLKRRPDLAKKVELTTKAGIKLLCDARPEHKLKSYDSSREHLIGSCENSLRELQVEQIKLFLIHRPDFLMDVEEVAEAFRVLHKSGKAAFFGVSNFSPTQFELLHKHFPLVNHQIEISAVERTAFKNGLLEQCQLNNVVPTAWSPFGGGAIFADDAEQSLVDLKKVATDLARQYGITIDQIFLAWLRTHPAGIVPILGSTKIDRIDSALKSLEIKLSREEWYTLWQAAEGEPVA